jgi:hypothetical protein
MLIAGSMRNPRIYHQSPVVPSSVGEEFLMKVSVPAAPSIVKFVCLAGGFMQGRAVAVVLSLLVLLAAPMRGFAAEAKKPIGRITASFGQTQLQADDKSRPGDLYSAVNNEDRVQTDGGGVSILLASRVVLKMDAESAIRISETAGQTMIVLEHGTVHVYVGQRPTPDSIVTLADANTRIECKQGVYLASYSDKAQEGYYACEHGSVSLTATNEKKTVTLAADKQMVVKHHQSSDVVDLDRVTFDQCKKYLERLDQITVAEGADTFRMRSRTLDTQTAIAQLAAAGWIDKAALARNSQAAAAANTSENSTANSTDSSSSNSNPKKNSNSGDANAVANSGNSNNASNSSNNSNAQTTGTPPAQNVPTVDTVADNNTGATGAPPIDLGRNGNGPKDKFDRGEGKDGTTASFTTPPSANVPSVSTPPVANVPPVSTPPIVAPPVDISGVNPVAAPVVTNTPPVVDPAPPVDLSAPPVNPPLANLPPTVDPDGGNGHGKGHGKGGGDPTALAVTPPPPPVTPPPPVNIDPIVVNVAPVIPPMPIDVTPAAPTPPINVAQLPPVNVPDVTKSVDGGGKGDKLAKVDPTPVTPPPAQPPVVVPTAPTPVAPPPVSVPPVAVVTPPPVAPPPPTIDLPKVDPPTVVPPPSLPPVNVPLADPTAGKTTTPLPPTDIPTAPPVPPAPTPVTPPPDPTSTPPVPPANPPTVTPDPTPVTPDPTPVIPTPPQIQPPSTTTPPTVVSTDNSDKTTTTTKKKRGKK